MKMKRMLSNILRIGIMKRLHRGVRLTIIPSYTCNYKCHYCARKSDGDAIPRDREVKTIDEWKTFLLRFNETLRIREVVFTGGEPTILPYFAELSNWILDQGWFITFYTNLSNLRTEKIKQSTRLRIYATHHLAYTDPKEFCERWKYLDKIHRVDVCEIGSRSESLKSYRHKRTQLKPFGTEEQFKNNLDCIRVNPDFRMYLTCWDSAQDYIKDKETEK